VSLKDKAAIVGIGRLPFAKDIGRSEDVTALEASPCPMGGEGCPASPGNPMCCPSATQCCSSGECCAVGDACCGDPPACHPGYQRIH
jgi:hypothetical protein